MQLRLTRRFIRRFERLPKIVQERVREALENLTLSPRAGKRLTGSLEGEFSWRVGDYRIIYSLAPDAIFAETVGHRKDIYRQPLLAREPRLTREQIGLTI